MAITIIEADLDNLSHQQALLMILDSYARDEMGQGYGLDVDVRNRVIAGLKEHGKSLVLLAYDDNEPIGSAVVIIGFSTFNARPLLNIHDLSVLPEFRGRGIGYKLLEAVEAKAKALARVQKNIKGRRLVKSTKGALKGKAPVPDFDPINVQFSTQEIDALFNIIASSILYPL